MCERAWRPHVFMHSHDPSGPLSTLSHPTAQRLIGLRALTSASDWTTHRGSTKGRSGEKKLERTNVDTSLLLWLQLTGVNSNHQAWRTALCVSVVMWASLALRNRRKCLFMTPGTFLSPDGTLEILPFRQRRHGPKMFYQVWLQSDVKQRTKNGRRTDQTHLVDQMGPN